MNEPTDQRWADGSLIWARGGWRVVWYRGREQPFTVFRDGSTIAFAARIEDAISAVTRLSRTPQSA